MAKRVLWNKLSNESITYKQGSPEEGEVGVYTPSGKKNFGKISKGLSQSFSFIKYWIQEKIHYKYLLFRKKLFLK